MKKTLSKMDGLVAIFMLVLVGWLSPAAADDVVVEIEVSEALLPEDAEDAYDALPLPEDFCEGDELGDESVEVLDASEPEADD